MSSRTLLAHHPDLPLGKDVRYPSQYDASLLQPISRQLGRASLPVRAHPTTATQTSTLPFQGWDLWRGYELSWLNSNGLPQVAMLKLWIPCEGPSIIESKSFKLYLNSLNNARFANLKDVQAVIHADLSASLEVDVKVEVLPPTAFINERIEEPTEACIDNLSVSIETYQPTPTLLACDTNRIVTEKVFSRLLKSNCPVTGQPDWASVHISYTGPAIDHASLLRYIVSYRDHEGFHEQCVEQIFCDIMQHCKPNTLSVFARYTRRGGLDINPWRATAGMPEPSSARSAQQ